MNPDYKTRLDPAEILKAAREAAPSAKPRPIEKIRSAVLIFRRLGRLMWEKHLIMIRPSSESATRERYAAAATKPEAALCCPVDYDPQYLNAIPAEVIEKDYGCGDPSKHLHPGETVLDLGSGTGKICFIASQVVGPNGKVIGVDMTDDMLEVARRNAPIVAENIGHANVEFRKGRIQDLALDLEILDQELRKSPNSGANDHLAVDTLAADLRVTHPLIATGSIDVVVSNCVLNLVETHLKRQLFEEIFRVLKNGGRAVISDIVSDEKVPVHLQNDADLWSGCISGAYTEEGFLSAFAEAGFHGIEMLKRDDAPWQTVEGIEFRSVTIQAWKGKHGPCFERHPKKTKGQDYNANTNAAACRTGGDGASCC